MNLNKKYSYKIYTYTDKNDRPTVAAVSTYAGHIVKGIAHCASEDSYDLGKGTALAEARCGAKVSARRAKRAERKLAEALAQLEAAERHYDKMRQYFNDASLAEELAKNELNCLLGEM